jgi:hypothetical protein
MRGQRLQSRCKEPHGRRSRLSAIRDRQRHRLQRASDRRQRLGSEAHLWTQRLLGRGEQGQEGRGRLRKRDEEQPYGRHRHPTSPTLKGRAGGWRRMQKQQTRLQRRRDFYCRKKRRQG